MASSGPAPRTRLPRVAAALLVVALVVCGGYLRVALPQPPTATPDEFWYTMYAVTVYNGGLGQVRGLVHNYNDAAEMKVYPSPTRAGYIAMIAGMMHLSGHVSVVSGMMLSSAVSALALALLAWLAWRFAGPGAALATLLFAIASPLDLAIARRTWQDGVVAILALAMLYALLEHRARDAAAARDGRDARPVWAVVLFALGAWAVLCKETALLLLGLGTLALAWHAWRTRGPRRAVLMLAGGAATLAVAVVVLGALCGGFDALWNTLTRLALAESNDEYLRTHQQGSPLYYVRGLGFIQAVPFALGTLAAVLAVGLPAARSPWGDPRVRDALRVTGIFVLLFLGAACVYTQKNLRFLSPVYAPVYLLAGALVAAAVEAAGRRAGRNGFAAATLVAALILTSLAVGDVRRFHDVFVKAAVRDLSTPSLLEAPELLRQRREGRPPAAAPAPPPGP